MSSNNGILRNAHDHIMANTWRLIFDRTARRPRATVLASPAPDFALLEQILPEYRLIGLSLADKNKPHRLN